MKLRNKAVPAAYLILKKDNKVLLGRRKNTTYFDGWYGTPAGHIEAGELPIMAVIRETKEEIGISIDPKDVKQVHTMYRTAHDETGDRADYFFNAEKWEGEPKIMEPDKCDDLQWFEINKLPENLVPHEKDAILNIKKGINYSEVDIKHTVQNPSK